MSCSVTWILFDFGGVLADEGFTLGLGSLARDQGLDPETVQRDAFYPLFDRIYNSYHLGQSKQDPELFLRVIADLGITPGEALFVDDSPGNVHRAWIKGLSCILYTGKSQFLDQIGDYCLLDSLPGMI